MPSALALLDAPERAVAMDTEGAVQVLVGLFFKLIAFVRIDPY